MGCCRTSARWPCCRRCPTPTPGWGRNRTTRHSDAPRPPDPAAACVAASGHFADLWLDGLDERGRERAFERIMACRDLPLSAISDTFIDLDDFKQINDRYGHLVGDEVLRNFSSSLKGMLRKSDLLARYGGEEFLIVLGNCDAATAARTLQRILAEITRIPMAMADGVPVHVTFSAGLASQGDGERFDGARALLQAADQALYGAKRDGRNRITLPPEA